MGVHDDAPVLRETVGDPVQAVILLHGRGATADGMIELGRAVARDAVLLAPQAADRQWYPESFLAPAEDNQPWLDAALEQVDTVLEQAGGDGFRRTDCTVVGFSQGACLATEYAARRGEPVGGVFGFSGGLIGEAVGEDRYSGEMGGTPVYLCCDDDDPYVPVERVEATAAVFDRLGADVTTEIVPGMGHTVTEREREMLADHLVAVRGR